MTHFTQQTKWKHASGGSVSSTSEGAEVMAVGCYQLRRLIKTKTHELLPALVFRSATCQELRPSVRSPSPKQSLWGLQRSQSGLLKYTAWQINRVAIQGRSLDWDSQGVGRRGETHSTLINTWPHYLSHVAESHWGKFNTALLSLRGETGGGLFISACAFAAVCMEIKCLHMENRITSTRVFVVFVCMFIWMLAYLPVN